MKLIRLHHLNRESLTEYIKGDQFLLNTDKIITIGNYFRDSSNKIIGSYITIDKDTLVTVFEDIKQIKKLLRTNK